MKIVLSGLSEVKSLEFTWKELGLIELFSIAQEIGFDGVEYCTTIPDLFSLPQRVRELSKEYEIPILSLHAPMHLLFFTPELFFTPLAQLSAFFPDCTVFNFHLSGFIHPLQQNGKNLQKFITIFKGRDVSLSFESNPLLVGLQYYPKVTYDPEKFANYCIENQLPITFDTAHIAHCRYDIVTFFRKYHHQIKLIHLSDSIGKVQHLPLGKGNLPIIELLKELKRKKYNQQITFEIVNFPKDFTTKQKAKEIKNSFELVRKYSL